MFGVRVEDVVVGGRVVGFMTSVRILPVFCRYSLGWKMGEAARFASGHSIA